MEARVLVAKELISAEPSGSTGSVLEQDVLRGSRGSRIMYHFLFSVLPCPTDSPGIPVSATSKELFKGFSYVDPSLLDVSVCVCL